jgi:hypothetical protein
VEESDGQHEKGNQQRERKGSLTLVFSALRIAISAL